MLEGIPFDGLVSAMRRGEFPEALNVLLPQIEERVAKAIRRRFPCADFADDAVQSAFRTFFRRVPNGEYTLEGPGALERLLVVIALRKAIRLWRDLQRQPAPLDGAAARAAQPPPTPYGGKDPLTPNDLEDQRRKVREYMAAQLAGLLEKVEESLTHPRKKRILLYWFAKEYEGCKITQGEIAKNLRCSLATVGRDFVEITGKWQPLLEEARRALLEFRSQLVAGEDNVPARK